MATIGVCVFCAATSVVALFVFRRNEVEKKYMINKDTEKLHIVEYHVLLYFNFRLKNFLKTIHLCRTGGGASTMIDGVKS